MSSNFDTLLEDSTAKAFAMQQERRLSSDSLLMNYAALIEYQAKDIANLSQQLLIAKNGEQTKQVIISQLQARLARIGRQAQNQTENTEGSCNAFQQHCPQGGERRA